MKALLPSIFKFYDRFTTEENTDKTKPLTIQKGERLFFLSYDGGKNAIPIKITTARDIFTMQNLSEIYPNSCQGINF